ncbi:unnamed protein product [Discula destructiva]
MRWSAAALVGLTAGLVTAGCPYAEQQAKREACPYAKLQAARGPPSHPHAPKPRAPVSGKKGIFYMNRIAPSGSQLYISNADGSDATALMANQTTGLGSFDYHAKWSPDGNWIVFTSERRADGQADLYRVKPDGSGLETLMTTDWLEDAGALSPDGTQLAYVSTYGNYTTNVWIKDLATGTSFNLTDTDDNRANQVGPTGHYRPAWSPDGEWIAFSSDRETDWTGHSDGTGWEHTQTLALYIVRPDGTDLRKVYGQEGYSVGQPSWSPDGSKLLFHIMTTEDTYGAHGINGQNLAITGQVQSVDVATGTQVTNITSGSYQKVGHSYIGNSSNIGYLLKAGDFGVVEYTTPDDTHQSFNVTYMRNPSWSPDGSKIVYEVLAWDQRPAEMELFQFDDSWDYRFLDVFPMFNEATKRMAITSKQLGDSSIETSSFEYTDVVESMPLYDVWSQSDETELLYQLEGLGGFFQPTFYPDGSKLAAGLGTWFTTRNAGPATIYEFPAEGGNYTTLTDGTLNAGFPSYSPNGDALVYRLWDQANAYPLGIKLLNLTTGVTTNLTDGWDNTPGWSPDGERIVFTRQVNWTAEYGSRWYSDRFDVMTIKPDGSELTQLTHSDANDAHAVWAYDGRIMWSSGMYGFRDECVQFDNTFQPYGQIMIMNYDGSNKTMLTDSLWEDSMPMYIPNEWLS